MTQLLIIAHAPLATALQACAQHVFPDCGAYVRALDVPPQAAPDQSLAEARRLLESGPGGPALVLTDVFGATPANVAVRLCSAQVRVVAGVNLPMLLRAITYRHDALDALVSKALAGGTQGVMLVGAGSVQIQNQRPSTSFHDSEHHHHQQ